MVRFHFTASDDLRRYILLKMSPADGKWKVSLRVVGADGSIHPVGVGDKPVTSEFAKEVAKVEADRLGITDVVVLRMV